MNTFIYKILKNVIRFFNSRFWPLCSMLFAWFETKNKNIIVLSYQSKKLKSIKKNLDNYEFPAKLKEEDKCHVDYFEKYLNVKKSNKNINLFGSMNKEGNSKFWGLHYEL